MLAWCTLVELDTLAISVFKRCLDETLLKAASCIVTVLPGTLVLQLLKCYYWVFCPAALLTRYRDYH